MTDTIAPLDSTVLEAVAAAVAPRLPSAGGLQARLLTDLDQAVVDLGPDPAAVAVRVSGAFSGDVVLVTGRSATAAAGGHHDAAAALATWSPVLADVVTTLGSHLGHLASETPRDVEASGVLRSTGGRHDVVGLYDADVLAAAVLLTDGSAVSPPSSVEAGTFLPLVGGAGPEVDPRRLQLLRDVVMGVSVELGRTRMTVRELLSLAPGAIVELDRAAGSPVDLLVNGTLMARGEVVVVDEEFAVRVTEIVAPSLDGRIGA